jgi:hypothetical protein
MNVSSLNDGDNTTHLAVYVDDLFISKSIEAIQRIEHQLKGRFKDITSITVSNVSILVPT